MKRNLRFLFYACLCAVCGLSLPSVQAAEALFGVDVMSAYVWRGVTRNANPVIQPSLDVAHESGLAFNIWGNYDTKDYRAVPADDFSEVDLTLAYTLPLETGRVKVGVVEYLFQHGRPSTREVFAELGVSVDFLYLGVDLFYDFDEYNDVYAQLRTGLVLPCTDRLCFDLGGTLGGGGKGISVGPDGGLQDWMVYASASWPLTESLELGAVLSYVGAVDSDKLPPQDVDFLGGLNLYWRF